ncbi:pectate lyase [Colletotrichum falcatum]|nr:pectate lyase [Colletotrichum falcatum]
MRCSFALALGTLVLGIAAARAEEPSTTESAEDPKRAGPSTTRRPGSAITPASGPPGNGTCGLRVRVGKGKPAGGGALPASSGTSVLKAAQTVPAGGSFDGGMVAFDRGVPCTGQAEGTDADAVFVLGRGARLSNVIIGPNQVEGVHCNGSCVLDNVWWSAVCEDAFTLKVQAAGETTTITSGGAFGAADKVLQHNGAGTLSVAGFTVAAFGKLYRSCGNCKSMFERHVVLDDIRASSGALLVGINSNYGDTATFKRIKADNVTEICTEYEGNDVGEEPAEIGSGPSKACRYSPSDIIGS